MAEMLTVTPSVLTQRFRYGAGKKREPREVAILLGRWFLRWAKRNNYGIALNYLVIEENHDPSRREKAILASVCVCQIPAGSGMEPGYIIDNISTLPLDSVL